MSLRDDLPKALSGAWLVVSAVLGVCVAAPLLLPAEAIYGLAPECEAKAQGGRCAACGLTTGFLLMARGETSAARDANPAAPLLYAGFAMNFLGAAAYSSMALFKRRRTGDNR